MIWTYDVASLWEMQSSGEQDVASPSGPFGEFQ
jgi:hypothetical protein